MGGPVEVSRDDLVTPGGRTPPQLVQVDPEQPLQAFLEDLARWLPWPAGTACWTFTKREPGDRWAWTEWTVAVVHRDRLVLYRQTGTLREEVGAAGWQGRLHACHRSTAEPPATDEELLAVRRDSRQPRPRPVVEVRRDDVHPSDSVDLQRVLEVDVHLPVRTLLTQLGQWVPYPQRSQGWLVRVAGDSGWAGHVLAVLHPDRTALRREGVTVGALADAVGDPVRLSLEHRSSAAAPATDAELLG